MPQRIDVPGVGPVDFPDDMGDDQIVQAAAELHRQATLPQMPKLNTVFVQGAGDLIGPPPQPEPPVDFPLTDAQKSGFDTLNNVTTALGAVPDLPAALVNRAADAVSSTVANAGRSSLGILPGLQPLLDLMDGKTPSLNPAENYERFTQGPYGKLTKAGTEDQRKYYDDRLAEMPDGVKQTVDFLGSSGGSIVTSLPATVGGLPVLFATSLSTFAPAYEEARSKGASPEKAYLHAWNSTLAEAGSEYLGSAAARTSKFLGKMPFLPDGLRKFFDVAPRDALKEAIKEGGMSLLKRLGRTGFSEGLEEIASTLAQHVSAAMLFDPTQMTNVSDLVTDLFMSFLGGFTGGVGFTPLEIRAAKHNLRAEVTKGVVDQWQESLDAARKEGALRPEDEKAIPEAVSARMKMEVAAQRGDQTMLLANKLRLQKVLEYSKGTATAAEIAQQTEAEVLKAAEINRALEDPQHAQQVLQQAIEQFGPDSAVVERLQQAIERAPEVNKGFGMAFGKDIAKGDVPTVQGVPQLRRARAVMGDQIDAPWRQAIESENFTPDQYELRPGKGYRDNLTGRATDQPTDADGRLNQEIEGVYDQQSKKVVFFRGSIRDPQRLREVARHEGLHQAADTPEGQAKISEFAAQEIGRSQEMRDDVWGLARRYNGRDIPEEYIAHLYEKKKWWREPVDRLRAKLSEWFPKLGPAPAPVAGRILARSIVRNKGVIPNGQEVQSQVQDQEVTQPVPPVLDAAGTAPGTASTPAPAAPAASPQSAETIPAQSAHPSNLPGWLDDEIKRLFDVAQKAGVVPEIESLAAQRKTALEIANAIVVPGYATPQDKKPIVLAVRSKLGIPSMDMTSEFERWIQNRKAAPATAESPKPPVAPTVEASTPAPATPQKDERPFDGGVNRPRSDEPPIAEGKVRVYHGGGFKEASGDWTASRDYAEGYALMNGGNVWYVDLESDSPLLKPAYDDTGLPRRASPAHFSGTAETRDNAKSLGPPKPAPPVAEPTQETKPPESQATASNKAPSVETKSETKTPSEPVPKPPESPSEPKAEAPAHPEPTPTPKEEAKIQKKKEQADLQAELDAELGQTETHEPTKDKGGTTATDSVESKGRKPKRVAPPHLRQKKAKAESTPQPAPTPTKDISKGDRVEWDDDGVRRTGVVLERNAMGVSVDDDASGRRYLLASDRLKLLPPVEATPYPAPTPEPTPAPQNVAPEQPPLAAHEPAPIETPQPQPAPPAHAAPEVVPPTPVPGESELRKEERVEGKPEASNERKTSTAKALKVQKEYLVEAVTKALEEAPESVGSPDSDEIAAAQKEWDAAKLEAGKMQNLSDRETANASALEKYQSRIEILFEKYKTPTTIDLAVDGKPGPGGVVPRKTNELDFSQRQVLLVDQIKKAKWQGPTGITFDVPGDGVFTVVNDKPTLRKFLETVKKRFPKGDGRSSEPKMASTSEKSTPKEAALKTFTDRVKVVGVFASTDVTRKVVNRVAHAGGLLIATDGRQMAVIPAGESTTDVHQFNSQTGEQVKFEVDDKGAKSDLAQYPNWRQVLPSDPEWRAKADVAVLLKMVRGALQLWVGEERKSSSKPMQLFLDSDGNFGVKAIVPDSGEFESGVTEKSKIIGAFNADYLADGLEAAARMGNQSLWVATDEGLLGPASFLGTDFAYVLMPMRDAETYKKTRVTVKTAEADAQRSTLTEQWRKQLEIETTESTEPKKPKAKRKANGQKFSIIPTENRETLLAQDVQWFRNEYKSAPEIVFRDEPDDLVQEPVYYDPGFRQIVVVPRLLPRTRGARRSLFLGALADAGINLIPEAFWDSAWEDIRKVDPEMLKRAADALKVDVRESSGRRAVLRRLVEQRMQGPTRYGLVRSLLRMFRAESPTARVVARVARQIAKQSENFIPETPYTFATDSQEQVHADVNAAVWGLRSDVYALRDAANEVISRAIEDNQWQRIKNRLGELAEQGESASIGRGRRIRLNIDSPQFIAELEALQVPHNQSDVQAHHTWLDELEARRVVTLMDNLDKNRETLGFLDENLRTGSGDLTKQSSSVIEALKSRIARQQARLDRIETERPAVFDRANSIRRATDGMAEARAARATLTAPEIQPWIETIYEIERSGAIPRGMDEVSPSLRTPIEVASGLFGHHALEIQRSMRERMDRVSERLAKNLRKLQQRRRELRSKQGDVDVRVHELLTSIAGDAEASGGLFSRSVAQQVRERELAISRLAVFLGQAQPNSVAAEFTEAMTSGDIFAAMGSASAGELPAGAPSQERPVASDEAFGRNVAMIRAVAQGASITDDVLREILDMANRDMGFSNVVLMLADEADSRSERRMLDVIERVEAARESMLAHPQPLNAEERATREGFIAARGMLERLRLERSGASATLAEVEKEIQEAEIEQRSIAMLHQLAARAVELAGGEMGDRIGTAEMVYRTNSHGLHFVEFIKADGTKQESVIIGPNKEYTAEVIQKIIEWRQAAQEAVEEAQANPTNPPNAPHITRGLAVGAEKALAAIDAYSTPDNLLKTSRYKIFNLWLAKTEFAIRAILPRLIPGIHGRLFAESIAGYARLGRLLDAIAAKNHARRMKLLHSAYESLGLDPYNANHQSDLATAYAEVAHRYREHGSKVAVGDTLLNTSLRNKPITRELVTLLRFDRDLFREAQRIMQSEDYGGIRENLRGIRLVRPAAETGDIGLARKVNSEIERQIAANYEAALGADPKNPDMSQTWVAFPDIVRFHILDSLRSDLAFERNPILLELEQQYARDIRSGKVPPPSIASAFEDTVSALAVYANNRIASPHETIRKALSDELMVYARVARSRRASSVDSTTPMTRVGTYTGEDDTNEFTSPAAKLIYPSSMYEYGASGSVNDMRGALSNVLDVSQVSMLGSGKAAAEHLRTIADILKNIQDPRMNDEVRAVARWFTNSRPDVEVTQEVANSAATKVRAVAEAIERDLAHIQSPSVSPGGLQKFTGALMPFMLAAPRVGLSNVVGGPLSSRRILTPLIGAPLANLAAFGLTLHSLSYAVYNMTDWMVRKTVGIHLPRLGTSPEVMEWLQSIGWGSRIGYAELEGLKAHMGGGVGNATIRRIGQVGEVLESTVGSKVGTTGTDAHLNRMAATTLVPLMLRRMTAIANSWRNRLAKANIEVSGDVTGEWAIGDADIGNSAGFREMLREAGVHPEEFMAALARGEIDNRRFWLNPLGAKFGNAVLSEWNASTRTNRPSARGLRSLLLGWMTFEVSRTVDMFRQPVDRSATRKLMNTAITAGSMLLSSFAIYYFGVAVRQAMNDVQTTIARELAEAIASPPDDDDDLWDWIQNLLARFVSAWEINSAPQLTPKDKSWWNRPILAIAWDVLQTPAKSLGVDRIATGNGFMAPGPGILLQIAEAGILAARATMEVMTGKNVDAKVDAANASRSILGSFGELGRVLANFFHGTPRRQTTSAIRDAANAQGVQVVSRTAPSTFAFQRDAALQPELLGAALAFSEANPEDREAAKKRLVSVAQAIYQRAYDRVIERGGFTNPVEAKDEADRAGQRAVQSAVSSIEPVTRAIGRSVTPDEYAKLKTSGVLENPEVVRETKAVAAAAQALASTPTPTGRAMVNPSQAVTSPISHAGSGGGGFSSGGSSTRRPLGRRLPALRSRMPRLRRARASRVPRLRKPPKLRRPRL